MTKPTKEQIEEYIRNNKLVTDESYPRSDWWKFKQQRDEYKRQRDELIEDIAQLRERNSELEHENKALRLQADTYFEQWQDAKRKTQAFDDIAVTVLSEDNDVIKNMNNIVTKIVINNLERDE